MNRVKIKTERGTYGINAFVRNKLKQFDSMDHTFASLFLLMFSEKDLILYERDINGETEKITYGTAKKNSLIRAKALSDALSDTGKGSVVGLCMKNGPEWIESFWAILCAGYSPLLMNENLGADVLCEALSDLNAVAVVSDGRQFKVRTIGSDSLLSKQEEYTPGKYGTNILVMSSGTSSSVKICAYSAEEIYHQIRDSYKIIKKCSKLKGFYHGQLKQLDLLPFYHVFGLTALYIWFSFFSRTLVHLDDLSPDTILRTIRKHEVTHLFAVPMFWEKIYDRATAAIRERGEDTYKKFTRALRLSNMLSAIPPLSEAFSHLAFREVRDNLFGESIRFMITGGSNIRPEVLSFFNGIGYRLANGYGMSEIGISSVELSGRGKYLNRGFVGKPMSSLTYEISPDGELIVSGRTMASYILEGGRRTERPDRFNTRDLAQCQNGHFTILGRKDDLVIGSNGENLNPNLIEGLFDHPVLNGVALIDDSGPLLICSVSKDCSLEDLSEARGSVRDTISSGFLAGKISRLFFTKDELIGEGDFKLNRRKIKDRYISGGFTEFSEKSFEGSDIPDDDLYVRIAAAFAKALNKDIKEITLNADFFLDLGGTSLDYFALITDLHEQFKTSFPVTEGSTLNTVKALYTHISTYDENADTFCKSVC